MPVRIQGNGIQNHHAAKGIFAADGTEILQKAGERQLFAGNDSCFGKADGFTGEQGTSRNQSSMMELHSIWDCTGAQDAGNLSGQIFRQWLQLIGGAAGLIEVNPVRFSFPALGIVSVRGKFRRGGGGKALFSEGAVQGGLSNDLIKVILIQGDILPAQRGIRLFYPKGIVERKRMADLQKSFQCAVPILLEKLLDVLSVLGSTPPSSPKRISSRNSSRTRSNNSTSYAFQNASLWISYSSGSFS